MQWTNKTITPISARRIQRAFLRRAGHNAEILRLLAEQLPDCLFNMVDDQDRIMAFNRANVANCNFRDEYEAVGRKITDLFPPILAEAYVSLYREVRQTGRPAIDRPTAFAADRSSIPRRANVFPIRSADGRTVIGTATFYQLVQKRNAEDNWARRIKAATEYVEAHFAERISTTKLAEFVGLAPSTFRRVFTEHLQITPGDYISTIRINHARKLLTTTNLTIESIASECGFYDSSHFVKIFRKLRRETPTEYRQANAQRSD